LHLAADGVLEAIVGKLSLELRHHSGADLVLMVVLLKVIAF